MCRQIWRHKIKVRAGARVCVCVRACVTVWMIQPLFYTSKCLKLRMCSNWNRVCMHTCVCSYSRLTGIMYMCVLKARWLALSPLPPPYMSAVGRWLYCSWTEVFQDHIKELELFIVIICDFTVPACPLALTGYHFCLACWAANKYLRDYQLERIWSRDKLCLV